MSKDRRTHDQKRKAKLAKRATRQASDDVTPYDGKKYQADGWLPHVFETELAIYETIQLSGRQLTNLQVHAALCHLIRHLRNGQPALLDEAAPDLSFVRGQEVDYLVWNVRRHWSLLVQKQGAVAVDDLVGILRTLLYSIKAHAWNTGPSRGYVAFLEGFVQGVRSRKPAERSDTTGPRLPWDGCDR